MEIELAGNYTCQVHSVPKSNLPAIVTQPPVAGLLGGMFSSLLGLQLMPLILTETQGKTIHVMGKLPISLIFTTSSIASLRFIFPSVDSSSFLISFALSRSLPPLDDTSLIPLISGNTCDSLTHSSRLQTNFLSFRTPGDLLP
ncbi:hypothetical protein TNCV_2794661 [Trichonephila clavipes]|nr:hypothetical protein TNCV_2794661 [Trichonephila clavipes]